MAQGSILSPALFNIFIEDLAQKLADELGMSIEDILLYADDILLLCDSTERVRRCIEIVEQWSKDNGMQLNKKKSGIVVFAPRSAKNIPYMMRKEGAKDTKEWQPFTKEVGGVPIVNQYKYLGTFLDSKLTLKPQLNHIRTKSNFIFTKLYPYLSQASADGRRDMWQTMVAPLFDGILMLAYHEENKVSLENTARLWIGTFKKFLLLPKNTNTDLIKELIARDPAERVKSIALLSEAKWNARKERKSSGKCSDITKQKNYLRGIPNTFCEIVKMQHKLCCICKNSIMSYDHMIDNMMSG